MYLKREIKEILLRYKIEGNKNGRKNQVSQKWQLWEELPPLVMRNERKGVE